MHSAIVDNQRSISQIFPRLSESFGKMVVSLSIFWSGVLQYVETIVSGRIFVVASATTEISRYWMNSRWKLKISFPKSFFGDNINKYEVDGECICFTLSALVAELTKNTINVLFFTALDCS